MKQREFGIKKLNNNPTSSGRLAFVIPRSDAESSEYNQFYLMHKTPLDSASERGMTVTDHLDYIKNVTINLIKHHTECCMSNKTIQGKWP